MKKWRDDMRRLIDADELLYNIQADNTCDSDTKDYYIAMVEGMPTAYDVDKVVEQLENMKDERWPENSIMYGKYKLDEYARCHIDEAVSIVKGAINHE
jgi:hypothetical protein